MKKYFLVAATAIFAAFPLLSGAQSHISIQVNHLTEPRVYGLDFDVLISDFYLNGASGEVLNTLTVNPSGTARSGIEYTKLLLWADVGEPGFQGWGYDQQLAEGFFDISWVFDELNYQIMSDAERFFVSLESGAFIDNKIFQVTLDQPMDLNEDGLWQSGERGLFLDSVVVDNIPLTASTTAFFKDTKLDQQPPKAFVDNLVFGEVNKFIDPVLPLVFTGEARDRNFSKVVEVEVFIEDQGYLADNTGTNFSTWALEFTPESNYLNTTLHLLPMDGDGHNWVGPDYQIIIDSRQPAEFQSTISLSKDIVVADELDPLTITVEVRDENGAVLPYRSIDLVFERGGIEFASSTVETDENGIGSQVQSFGIAGDMNVRAKYKGMELSGASFEVVADTMPVEPTIPAPEYQPGDLIKGSLNAVYYFSDRGTRHVFVNQSIYESWYGSNFDSVKTISDAGLGSIPLGDLVGYRPGTMITSPSINEVYVVTSGQNLRHIATEQIAVELFGVSWNTMVNDLQESLLFVYRFGEVIDDSSQINILELKDPATTIDDELDLKFAA